MTSFNSAKPVNEERTHRFCKDVGKCKVCIVHLHIDWGGSITEDHYWITMDCGNGLENVHYWNTYN